MDSSLLPCAGPAVLSTPSSSAPCSPPSSTPLSHAAMQLPGLRRPSGPSQAEILSAVHAVVASDAQYAVDFDVAMRVAAGMGFRSRAAALAAVLGSFSEGADYVRVGSRVAMTTLTFVRLLALRAAWTDPAFLCCVLTALWRSASETRHAASDRARVLEANAAELARRANDLIEFETRCADREAALLAAEARVRAERESLSDAWEELRAARLSLDPARQRAKRASDAGVVVPFPVDLDSVLGSARLLGFPCREAAVATLEGHFTAGIDYEAAEGAYAMTLVAFARLCTMADVIDRDVLRATVDCMAQVISHSQDADAVRARGYRVRRPPGSSDQPPGKRPRSDDDGRPS
eukprot:m51a1_g8864 hypothetical protein (349) ;mRNA; r:576993-579903